MSEKLAQKVREEIQKMTEKVQTQPEKTNLLKHRLLQDNVLLLPLDFEGGDVVVKSRQYEDKPEWGLVVSKGDGRLLEDGSRVPLDVSTGDVVLFMSYGGTPVKVFGSDFIYVRQEDVISVYED